MSEADGGYGAGEESRVVDLADDAAQDRTDGAGALDDGADHDVPDHDGADHDVPEAPQTGDPGVDEAVAALRTAVAGPLDGQVTAYDAVHRALQDRLADVEG